jgi:uridine kinase
MNLIEALYDLTKSLPTPIITIDGPAGAGKTTLASHLSTSLGNYFSTSVIHMDDLYNGWQDPFSGPFIEALKTITESHGKKKSYAIPQFDWALGAYGPAKSSQPSQLLILEGVGSSTSHIRDVVSASIWIDIKPEVGLQRVLTRDGTSIASEMQQWLKTQETFFTTEKSAELADFALTT